MADAVEVALTVEWDPEVDRLCFWALQVAFVDGHNRLGAAHLGLQWNLRHPGSRAVNWGGYDRDGRILDGTVSELRSAPADRNTRDYAWKAGVPYRLRIESAGDGWWSGSVTPPDGPPVEVRRLRGGGTRLASPVVWSEIFARCEAPSVAARWTDPALESGDRRVRPDLYRVSYQTVEAGGCSNTTVIPVDGGVRQVTNARRAIPSGVLIRAV